MGFRDFEDIILLTLTSKVLFIDLNAFFIEKINWFELKSMFSFFLLLLLVIKGRFRNAIEMSMIFRYSVSLYKNDHSLTVQAKSIKYKNNNNDNIV